jgi:hypothetical protein
MIVLAWIASACASPGSGGPPPSPTTATTATTAGASSTPRDARCRTPSGGVGVNLDGTCQPVVLHAAPEPGFGLPRPATQDPQEVAAVARLSAEGCAVASNVATGDGAVFVHVACGDARSGSHQVVRLDAAGTRSAGAPRSSIAAARWALVSFVPGARPLVVAVLEHAGTSALDARTLATLAHWDNMGHWANAASDGATASPDGAWFAVPSPAHGRIDFVRTRDLAWVASLAFDGLVDRAQGPGRVAWSDAALDVTTVRLPYE